MAFFRVEKRFSEKSGVNQTLPNFRSLTASLIAGYKDAASLSGVGYSNISGIFLGIIRKRILGFSKSLTCNLVRDDDYNAISAFYLELIRLIYFVLATDTKSRNVDLAFQSLILLYENVKWYDPVLNQVFSRTAEDGFVGVFLKSKDIINLGKSSLEFVSSLIAIAYISPFFRIPQQSLIDFWKAAKISLHEKFSDDFPYFEAVSLLFYIQDRQEYSSLRNLLYRDLRQSIKGGGLTQSTSTFMAFLDYSACPYFDETKKKSLVEEAWLAVHNQPPKDKSKIGPALTALAELPWFVDWSRKDLDIRKALFRKELQSVY